MISVCRTVREPEMSDVRDLPIKLFGKTIHAQSADVEDSSCRLLLSSVTALVTDDCGEGQEGDKVSPGKELTPDAQEDGGKTAEEPASADVSENPGTPSLDAETSSLMSRKNGEQGEPSLTQEEKAPKKPIKILPCPRCSSMETKFCYFNNYNVNQPRHFCKSCQRYWTAGGTMRNVPVGAGRRKNKNSSVSEYRHIMLAEALQTAGAHVSSNYGSFLSFGSDPPLCDSGASDLSLCEKPQSCMPNGYFQLQEQRAPVSSRDRDNGDDHSSRSSIASCSSKKGDKTRSQEQEKENCQHFPPKAPSFPGPSWPYYWSATIPPPPFFPAGFPVSFYSSPSYCGCAILAPPSSSCSHSSTGSFTRRPTLGKHSRDGNIIEPVNSQKEDNSGKDSGSDRCTSAPRTLRIDDPAEAAKSSIWATVEMKNGRSSTNRGGFLKAFQLSWGEPNHVRASPFLQVNPAALSRSLMFRESA